MDQRSIPTPRPYPQRLEDRPQDCSLIDLEPSDLNPRQLKVIAVANSPFIQKTLEEQLMALDFVDCNKVLLELADAHSESAKFHPDVILVDLTDRELDGGLFIQAMSMDENHPYVLFALHSKLDHTIILESVRQGAKEFIQYPKDQQTLTEAS